MATGTENSEVICHVNTYIQLYREPRNEKTIRNIPVAISKDLHNVIAYFPRSVKRNCSDNFCTITQVTLHVPAVKTGSGTGSSTASFFFVGVTGTVICT